ncbi:MAG: chemotaxis protein CheD [Myxococcota bacterium]
MQRLMCGPGDIVASGHAGDELVSYALGSCVAVMLHDPVSGAVAMAHVVLPGRPPPDGGASKPGYYAPSAVSALFTAFATVGGVAIRAKAALAGGASVIDGMHAFDVGHRNILATRKALWSRGLMPYGEDVAGGHSRTVRLAAGTGSVTLTSPSIGTWTLN